ncbi:MAG: histidine phosphatase family protein [Kiritimatiellaceae bacterium]|nr:histidine phosphatase family protein [Kiritimatiellaceae bacterium]
MPKTLYLVRHAKSSWAENEQPDFERPLNHRGLRDAQKMGQRLKEQNAWPEIIVCSPATRAVQTLENLNLEIENVVFNKTVYEAEAVTLLTLIQSLDDQYESAMLIGHNPAITGLAGTLSGTRIENMPACAIATIQLTFNHWKKTGIRPAKLLNIDCPMNRP